MKEVRDVIAGREVIGPRDEILEVKNAYAAYEELPNIDPYSIRDFKRIHGIMTKGLISESGTFRQGEEGVFDGKNVIFVAPPPGQVPSLMKELFSWMKNARKELNPLIVSSVFHYEAVFIHPFADGNGRMARLWQTAILAKWRQIDAALGDLLIQASSKDNQLSVYVSRLLEVMEYDVPYTSSCLMEKVGIKTKDSFRNNYLNPAMEMGLIEMTVPDKPRSRNQRYIKK